MSTKSYTEEAKDNIILAWKGFQKWLDAHDSDGWAILGVFFAVVTLGMYMSYEAFRIVVGNIPALLISVFFEASILAWKVTGSRKRNDSHQNQLANWATWLSVLLAVSMLIVNLFRVGGQAGFESIAYIIVGTAACVQVVFYLLFDQANPDKQMAREHSQANRELTRKQVKAHNVIGELESDVQIIRYIVQELQRISNESRDLPIAQREYLLEAARQKLLAQYADGKDDIARATQGLADINKDGRIGDGNKLRGRGVQSEKRLGSVLPIGLEYKNADLEENIEPVGEEPPIEMPTIANEFPPELQEEPEQGF